MRELIDKMLEAYESGRVSRRSLLQALAAVAAAAPAAPGSTFKGAGLNHIAVRVKDIPRARTFYQDLLGLPLIRESANSLFLKAGDEFLTFFKGDAAGLDHFCLAIENFQPDAVMAALNKKGLNPRRAAGTDRIYFRDPDGLEVQLSAVGHMA